MIQLWILLLFLPPQAPVKPLPEAGPFFAEFRKTLRSDQTLLRQYTYTDTETHITLDSNGHAKNTEVSVYQILHGDRIEDRYRRLISKNGVPVSEKELAKRDRHEEADERRQTDKAKEDRKEQEIMEDIFSMYQVQMLQREPVGNVSTILITFAPKPNYKPRTSEGKMLQHISGRAWISEEDHELAKLETQVNDPISIGAGILAKLQRGSTLNFERRKINDEIWLPVKVEVNLNARLLLFKGFNFRQIDEYSDHKKYTVDTILKFGDVPPKPIP
jgi:hypothetical protein